MTDNSWLFTDKGAVVDSDYLDGENYDARLLPMICLILIIVTNVGKHVAFFHGQASQLPNKWTFTNPIKFELTAQEGPSAVIERVLTPISMQEIPTGHFVYDLGQNMVGTVRLHLRVNVAFQLNFATEK